jgi:hypothetical protein
MTQDRVLMSGWHYVMAGRSEAILASNYGMITNGLEVQKTKVILAERQRVAKEWLAEHPDIAQRLAKHIGWKTFFLEVEDEFDLGLPDAVKWWVKKSAI